MQDNRGLAPDLADWAVDTWSYALGVGLGRRSDRLESIVVSEPHPAPAAGTNSQLVWGAAAGAAANAFAAQHPTASKYRASQPQNAPAEGRGEAQALQAKANTIGQQSSSKKAIGAIAAAVALYFAYNHYHQPKPMQDCPAGQTQAADGSCVATPTKPKQPEAKRQDPAPKTVVALAAGTLIPVSVNETLNSDTVTIGRYVNGIVTAPVIFNGKTVVPEGTQVGSQVKSVDPSGRIVGAAKIDLALVEMTIGAKKYTIASAQGVVIGPSKTKQTAKDVAIAGTIGTGIGCGIGRVFHHTAAGCIVAAPIATGGGGLYSANSKPKPAVLEPGKVVRFALGQPVQFA